MENEFDDIMIDDLQPEQFSARDLVKIQEETQ